MTGGNRTGLTVSIARGQSSARHRKGTLNGKGAHESRSFQRRIAWLRPTQKPGCRPHPHSSR
jgi:hypothetical protein